MTLPTPRVSFEFFPPQSLEASFRLWETLGTLAPLAPEFVSVTYGAGGTTRDLTHDAVKTIHANYGVPVAAHLTCVDATRAETLAIADSYAAAGVTRIVALRGDPPRGATGFQAHPEGFASSVELVEALAATGRFDIAVGAYPDPHPDLTGSCQYRLRGMATLPDWQGRGLGFLLLDSALQRLTEQGCDLLWCNARVIAEGYYLKFGMQRSGPEFEIEGIGPHWLMFRQLS